jgi:hypothetical protein
MISVGTLKADVNSLHSQFEKWMVRRFNWVSTKFWLIIFIGSSEYNVSKTIKT